MKETLRHTEAFEYYYSLGNRRSYPQVALKFVVSRTSIVKWACAHKWAKRVQQRDIKIARRLKKKTDTAVVNSRADYRKEIKENLRLLKAILGTALRKVVDKDGNLIKTELVVSVNNAKNVAAIIQAYEKLVKLDLLICGDATERIEAPPSILVLPQTQSIEDWEKDHKDKKQNELTIH